MTQVQSQPVGISRSRLHLAAVATGLRRLATGGVVATAVLALAWVAAARAAEEHVAGGDAGPGLVKEREGVQAVIDRVEQQCRTETIFMIGPVKARRLAELVRKQRPGKVVECGTAIGYSGLWMARELKALGRGKLITIEIHPDRARRAKANFRDAGLGDYVEVLVGDARTVVKTVEGPVDFAFIDCNYSNYLPCLQGLEGKFSDAALLVADNVGIGAAGMKDYLDSVRSRYPSRTEWFDLELPWAQRDAMEVTVIRPKAGKGGQDK